MAGGGLRCTSPLGFKALDELGPGVTRQVGAMSRAAPTRDDPGKAAAARGEHGPSCMMVRGAALTTRLAAVILIPTTRSAATS